MTFLIFLTVLAQAQAPVLPAGVGVDFQRRILEAEALLEKGSFAAAESKLAPYSNGEVTIVWNDKNVPSDQRAAFASGRDQAFATWQRFAPNLQFKVATEGKLEIVFAATNPPRPDRDVPSTLQFAFTETGARASIGLQRGKPLQPTTAIEVHNDVARAIGLYLGLADSPFGGSALFPNDLPNRMRVPVLKQDSDAALANIAAVVALRQSAAAKQKVTPARSALVVGQKSVDLGEVLQGTRTKLSVDVENKGSGPLALWIRPDCGCLTLNDPPPLKPGEKRTMDVVFDSREFKGDVSKKLVLVTNDPDNPLYVIDLKAKVSPAYRFIAPDGAVAVLGEDGGKLEVFLTFKDIEPFAIKRVDFNGIQADITYQDWIGSLPDPEMGEGFKARKGYKFVLDIMPSLPPGRSPGTLSVITDSKEFPLLMFTVQAQKGIIALPDELFWGEMAGAKEAKFLVSRPGNPFQVLSASADSPHLKLVVKPTKSDDEFLIEVAYDGKAPKGEFKKTITIKTDDPKQTSIVVPVLGTVR